MQSNSRVLLGGATFRQITPHELFIEKTEQVIIGQDPFPHMYAYALNRDLAELTKYRHDSRLQRNR